MRLDAARADQVFSPLALVIIEGLALVEDHDIPSFREEMLEHVGLRGQLIVDDDWADGGSGFGCTFRLTRRQLAPPTEPLSEFIFPVVQQDHWRHDHS